MALGSAVTFGLIWLTDSGNPLTTLPLEAEGPFELIVFMEPGATPDHHEFVQSNMEARSAQLEAPEYCDIACSLAEADELFASSPETRALITAENVPTSWRAQAREDVSRSMVTELARAFSEGPGVFDTGVGPRPLQLFLPQD